MRSTIRLALAFVLPVALVSCGEGPFGSSARAVTGEWGGDGIQLTATSSSAEFVIGCALGRVPGGLLVDDDGAFAARGVVAFSLAPGSRPFEARYRGGIADGHMMLTVDVVDRPEIAFRTFDLVRGWPASMPFCA